MFERRLKILLGALSLVVVLLLLHGAQAQLLHRDYWKSEALEAVRRPHLVGTLRGRILDINGKVLAMDAPGIDACVDFRAIEDPPDPVWVQKQAIDRLKAQPGNPYEHASRSQRPAMLKAEIEHVKADIEAMWAKLAQVSGRTPDEIEETRDAVAHRVETLRYDAELHAIAHATKKEATVPTRGRGWKKWFLAAGEDDSKANSSKPGVRIMEEQETHVILPDLDIDTQNELGKNIDRYPGLELRPGTHRAYPYGDLACHVLGHLARVSEDDLTRANKNEGLDKLHKYLPGDLIGRAGIEAMCEPLLRGTRGEFENEIGSKQTRNIVDPVPGQDVKLSIDIDLQRDIQQAFSNGRIWGADGQVAEPNVILHGAAIVLDVKTGEVRAMVSYPTYDANKFDEIYAKLKYDDLNQPLLNRATSNPHEPGSTVKPMVGLAALSEGKLGLDEGIECKGFLYIDGKKYSMGRCWVASMYLDNLGEQGVQHHPIPFPHPTGFLTFSDGLERSCNVVFETLANRLGPQTLCDWYRRFGLGRPTGIGIAEARGHLLTDSYDTIPKEDRRWALWFSGIGQGYIQATPIQMVNVAATVARKGIWMRPTLLGPQTRDALAGATTQPADGGTPAVVDLHIAPAAIAAAWDGMNRVVNGRAGTGKALIAGDEVLARLGVAGKTGTAQANPFFVRDRDTNGNVLRDEYGNPEGAFLVPSTPEAPNLMAPWYRGTGKDARLDHAWYMGFAPADRPQIAFVALVEYGGSGGAAAGSVARQALQSCIAHHYLPDPTPATALNH